MDTPKYNAVFRVTSLPAWVDPASCYIKVGYKFAMRDNGAICLPRDNQPVGNYRLGTSHLKFTEYRQMKEAT